MKENLKLDIIKNVLSCNFDKVAIQIKELQYDELENLLLKIGYDYGQSIVIYAFINYIIKNHEMIEYHFIAISILCGPLCYIEGAYNTALYHNRRILDMDSENIEAKIMMLFFNTLPQKLIDDIEAKKIAQEILQVEPENIVALQLLSLI